MLQNSWRKRKIFLINLFPQNSGVFILILQHWPVQPNDNNKQLDSRFRRHDNHAHLLCHFFFFDLLLVQIFTISMNFPNDNKLQVEETKWNLMKIKRILIQTFSCGHGRQRSGRRRSGKGRNLHRDVLQPLGSAGTAFLRIFRRRSGGGHQIRRRHFVLQRRQFGNAGGGGRQVALRSGPSDHRHGQTDDAQDRAQGQQDVGQPQQMIVL